MGRWKTLLLQCRYLQTLVGNQIAAVTFAGRGRRTAPGVGPEPGSRRRRG